MHEFAYHRPGDVATALRVYRDADDPSFLAGGQTLIATLKQRLATPSDLVDLGSVAGLAGIRDDGAALVIGAMTRHADVARDAVVRARIPALAALAGGIGDDQVRNRGTLGGSVANSDPAADYPAAVLGLGATIVTDRREIAADDWFLGMFTTALARGELITAIRFPVPEQAAYTKLPHPASRYAVVGVFVSRQRGAVRVAVTGAGPCAFRVPAMEQALARSFAPAALDGIAIDPTELNSDLHASAEFRAHLVGVVARRTVAAMG